MSTCPDYPKLSCLLFYHYPQSFEYSKVYRCFFRINCTLHLQYCTYIFSFHSEKMSTLQKCGTGLALFFITKMNMTSTHGCHMAGHKRGTHLYRFINGILDIHNLKGQFNKIFCLWFFRNGFLQSYLISVWRLFELGNIRFFIVSPLSFIADSRFSPFCLAEVGTKALKRWNARALSYFFITL